MIKNIIDKAENTHTLSKDEIVTLLTFDGNTCGYPTSELFQAADRTRKKYKGDGVHLRALIEFTNYCKRNCLYCGIRKDNQNVQRYRLSIDEIANLAKNAYETGYKTVVLQGGEDPYYDTDILTAIIKEIKKYNLHLTMSIGELPLDVYKALKSAGADRFLLRIETTDKDLYHSLSPDMFWEERFTCLKYIKSVGFETGSGSLVGLPNQSIESMADDILFFKEIKADMIGIGPFISHDDTPLKGAKNGDFWLSIRVMAIIRLLLPHINIPATTAMETLMPNGRLIALQAGANVIMPNVTTIEKRKNYTLYPGKYISDKSIIDHKNEVKGKLESINRYIE